MTDNDDSLLEWLDEHGLPAPPRQIHLTMEDPPTYNTVFRRLSKLSDMGLVEKHPDASGYYRITDDGRKYLHDPDATIDEFMPDEEEDEDDDREESEE